MVKIRGLPEFVFGRSSKTADALDGLNGEAGQFYGLAVSADGARNTPTEAFVSV